MADFQRITRWTTDNSITPASLNREFDNLTAVLNNVSSGIIISTGLLVKTPDGLHTYLLGVDNDGTLTSTFIS